MVDCSNILFSQSLWREMAEHVNRNFPEEACGMVGGEENRATVVFPITNDLHSPTTFLMNAEEQIKALMLLEESKLDLLAIYHSHPTGPDTPSESDVNEFAYPGVVVIIWTLGEIWRARGYIIHEKRLSKSVLLLVEG
jgi:proteasome lid subunit RPN8/RPN11